MRRNLWLLAISRMDAGFCIAGIPENSSDWVRPVRRSGQISRQDLIAADGRQLDPLDLVGFDLIRNEAEAPHVEDWVADLNRQPVIASRPIDDQREAVLGGLAEPSPNPVLMAKERSLVLVEASHITSALFDPVSFGRYRVRIAFSVEGVHYSGESGGSGYPCTDIKLRNWGRRFTAPTTLNDRQLRQVLGVDRVFLVLGLARWYNDNYWPMVVGLHTVPDYSGAIDLSNP